MKIYEILLKNRKKLSKKREICYNLSRKKGVGIMANTKKAEENKTQKKKTTAATKETNKNVKEEKSKQTKKTPAKKTENKKEEETKTETKKIVKIEEKNRDKEENTETKNTTKKVIIAVLLVIFCLTIFYLSTLSEKGEYTDPPIEDTSSNYDGTDVSNESANIKEEEKQELTSITIDEYLDKKKNDEKYSIIYIGRPTCSHCEIQKPIMEYLVYKYGVEISYLDTDTLDEDGFTKLQSSDDFFKEGWGTPLTMIVKGDKMVDYIEGEASIEEMTKLFKKYELISEGE